MKKMRLSTIGLGLSLLSTAPLIYAGINYIHGQGGETSQAASTVDTKVLHEKEVTEDINNKLNWNISLGVYEGKNIGDVIGGYSIKTLGARTVVSVPLPGKSKSPDQVYRVDQSTGIILNIFSKTKILETIKKEPKS